MMIEYCSTIRSSISYLLLDLFLLFLLRWGLYAGKIVEQGTLLETETRPQNQIVVSNIKMHYSGSSTCNQVFLFRFIPIVQ